MSAEHAQLRVRAQPLSRDDVVLTPLRTAIDPHSHTPRLLALVSNALVYRQSQRLRERFDLGSNEWRVLSGVARMPGLSAKEISETLSLNKAVISTAVQVLARRDLVVQVDGPRGSRPLYLTEAGATMHNDMARVATGVQADIRQELSAAEVVTLNALLERLREHTRES